MLSSWQHFRDWAVLFGLLLLSLLLMVNVNTSLMRAFRAHILEWTMSIENRWARIGDFLHALEENEQLRQENIRLAAELALLQNARLENQRLRQLLGYRQEQTYPLLAARIVAKDITRQQNTFVINRGEADGVTTDMAVIDHKGILGRVILTSKHYALVQSYLNTAFRLSAKIQPSGIMGIVRWEGDRLDRLLLEHVVRTANVRPGQEVVTSGYSDIYPPGLKVGYITSVIHRPGSNELVIHLKPAASLLEAEHAFVILSRPDPEKKHLEEAPS